MSANRCLFCGGDARSPEHFKYCDGRQGHVEAALLEAEEPLPILASGLTPETYSTSVAAAHAVEDGKEAQRHAVLEAIRSAGDRGATDDEVQTALALDGNSERPRRWELWKLNRIDVLRDSSGATVKRHTRTQRRAIVWIAR
jgi:hypothetical protein